MINPEDYYMTCAEVAEFLNVSIRRVMVLSSEGRIKKLKGSVYDRASVEAYKEMRGDKKGGRYPTKSQ
jgi:hypothetical protein